MSGALASNASWLVDVPSMAAASRQSGLLDSLEGFEDLRVVHLALTKWPEGRALLSRHRIGEFNDAWMLAMPSSLWQPSLLRKPYDLRTYNGTSLYEGDGWAAARTDAYVWIATSDLLIEEVLRRSKNSEPVDSTGLALLELLPEGGMALSSDAAQQFGSPAALSFRWAGSRTLQSSEYEYPDSLTSPIRQSGSVLLPPVDSTTIAVGGNAVRFTDDERELETIGSGQGVWKTFVRRQPFIMASWQTWADSSRYLSHWTPLDSVHDRWTSSYPQYAYTKSYGTSWVSTDDTLRFDRSVVFSLKPADFEGEFIQRICFVATEATSGPCAKTTAKPPAGPLLGSPGPREPLRAPIKALKFLSLNQRSKLLGIAWIGGVARLLKSLCPTPVVVGLQVKQCGIPLARLQKFTVVAVRIPNAAVAAKALLLAVVVVVHPSPLPALVALDSEVVTRFFGQMARPVRRLEHALS